MDLKQATKEVLAATAEVKTFLKKYFQDQTKPFNTRWKHFILFYSLGGEDCGMIYPGWNDLPMFSGDSRHWSSHFGIERYTQVNLVDLLLDHLVDVDDKTLQELEHEFKDVPEYWNVQVYLDKLEDLFNSNENYKMAKEALMRDAVTEFTYDW